MSQRLFFRLNEQSHDRLAGASGVLRSLLDRGSMGLITTHDMEEADALCDRVAIIHDGKMVALDTPAGPLRRAGGGLCPHCGYQLEPTIDLCPECGSPFAPSDFAFTNLDCSASDTSHGTMLEVGKANGSSGSSPGMGSTSTIPGQGFTTLARSGNSLRRGWPSNSVGR